MNIKKALISTKNITYYAIKAFFRDRQAIFWSLFLPIMIMSIFGVMKFDEAAKVNLGIVDEAKNKSSIQLVDTLKKIDALRIKEGDKDSEKKALEKGDRDLVLIVPQKFSEQIMAAPQNIDLKVPANWVPPISQSSKPLNLELYYNEGKASNVQVGQTILTQVFDKYSDMITNTPDLFVLDKKPISSRNLSYVDFLLPGIVAMGIMQMGIIGVAAGIVTWRERGILRRLLATPVHPATIIFSQIVTRLTISIMQSATIITLGVAVFHVHIIGSFLNVFILTILGGTIFLSIGLALSGFGKTHNTVMALSNVVMMPMMFLSGVFFPRDALPDLLKSITQYMPLTYLADGMRKVMVEGSGLIQIQAEIFGLLAWIFISFILAIKFFKWE
ncbi:hypothetical protein COX95_01685 [bacterium CG_4_10_14_0_2_um_filter_33_32]|nr:MAG: hypothetical protein AUJ93_01635 [bacterium CG2_30_33_46]PIR67833.1 MAG: hypothetical protein COU50_01205 [bacterium CG10_big_fil_rev_8_21_14_0_10_33_18]PIU76479.1 MAG: hypothetical protein COS74_03830 [bacterium CG06_land_8_20_14_3_00_33_50]PIW81354.1 MAG: hypothetical protein COZ97_02215 [bacterium CG_4_8_14_3_um_filter_33_28]PIY85183.1 MAG: hypothetical protein COY76_03460 [bacterium CG_4_10_14_0_8_um_filter_33_57]PIZ86307.1 MAG: hypothetical protein COX95_01685 [bacterium CG_4_10_1